MEDRTLEAKKDLIRQLDDARAELLAVLAGIDTQTEIYPTWKLKELLAHLSGWDEATIASLQIHIDGGEPLTPAARGIDFYNAESVATREALSYEQVAKELTATRDRLKEIILNMSPDKFEQPMIFAWGPKGLVPRLVAVFVHHEREHAKEIRELFEG